MNVKASTNIRQSCKHTFRLIPTNFLIPYSHERGPMGGAPYGIGPRLGDGPIFEASVSHLDAKERPGKLPMLSS